LTHSRVIGYDGGIEPRRAPGARSARTQRHRRKLSSHAAVPIDRKGKRVATQRERPSSVCPRRAESRPDWRRHWRADSCGPPGGLLPATQDHPTRCHLCPSRRVLQRVRRGSTLVGDRGIAMNGSRAHPRQPLAIVRSIIGVDTTSFDQPASTRCGAAAPRASSTRPVRGNPSCAALMGFLDARCQRSHCAPLAIERLTRAAYANVVSSARCLPGG
jgi:hypothetical protein